MTTRYEIYLTKFMGAVASSHLILPAKIGSILVNLSGPIPAERQLMRIFIFKSDINPELRAFSDDQGGNKLPAQFRPWHAIGVVRPELVPPHNLNREVIEASIAKNGFQLWRMKS